MDAKEVANKDEQKQVELPPSEAEFNSDPMDQETPDEVVAKNAITETKEEQVDYKALYEAEKAKVDEHKRRYVASSKESRKLRTKLKQFEAERVKATTEQITDDELAKKYQDWDDLTSQEQMALRRAENAERRAAAIEEAQRKAVMADQFSQDLEDFLEIAEAEGSYPDVREQADKFRKFAKQDANKGRDIEELAKIFTFDNPKGVQPRKPDTPFGNSGHKHEDAQAKMSWQQKQELRKNNPRKYEEMLEKGII